MLQNVEDGKPLSRHLRIRTKNEENNMRAAYVISFLALVLVATIVTQPDSVQPNAAAAVTPTTMAGSVTLVNSAWNRVTIEVRKGKYDDVNQNAAYETRTMGKGRWTIPCAAEEGYVWWRRDADPDHPNGQWTGWTRKACFGKDDETSL
jgi:hypothetical protein